MKIIASLFGLAALMTADAGQAQDQFAGIGFYMGNPTPQAAIPRYNSFVSATQQKPNITAMFIDYREPIWSAVATDPQWASNARWAAKNLALVTSANYLN